MATNMLIPYVILRFSWNVEVEVEVEDEPKPILPDVKNEDSNEGYETLLYEHCYYE